MTRTLSAFAIAVALVGTLVASTSSSYAQSASRHGTAGAYDRAVNGSLASTPGAD